MATITVEIDHVAATVVGNGLEQWIVTAMTPTACRQFQTFNKWQAALCQIAHDKQLPVEIHYSEGLLSRFGHRWKPRITDVFLLPKPSGPQ